MPEIKIMDKKDMEYAVAGLGGFAGVLVNQAVPQVTSHGLIEVAVGGASIVVGSAVNNNIVSPAAWGFGIVNVGLGLYDMAMGKF